MQSLQLHRPVLCLLTICSAYTAYITLQGHKRPWRPSHASPGEVRVQKRPLTLNCEQIETLFPAFSSSAFPVRDSFKASLQSLLIFCHTSTLIAFSFLVFISHALILLLASHPFVSLFLSVFSNTSSCMHFFPVCTQTSFLPIFDDFMLLLLSFKPEINQVVPLSLSKTWLEIHKCNFYSLIQNVTNPFCSYTCKE